VIRFENAANGLVIAFAIAMTFSLTASCSEPRDAGHDQAVAQQTDEMQTMPPREVVTVPLDATRVSADEFPGPWGEDGFSEVAITLGRSRITGCGEFSTRRQRNEPNRFLVYCTRDGDNWTAHLVDISTQQVRAISTPPADIPNPY
jgi:hypothetical protein